MKVLYFLRDNGGCGWYRLAQPLQAAAFHKGFEVKHVEKGDGEDDIAQKLLWADVCVTPRVFDEKFCKGIEQFKALGKKVVVDWDDNFFDVSPLSPHYKDFGTENYSHSYDGGKLDIWVDGKNIDLAKNKAALERAKKAMATADMVTTTTDVLANVFKESNPNVKVLPNCIDFDLWQKLPFKDHKGVRVGWSGGYSHFEDWKILAYVLPEFMRVNPNVTLVLLGQKFEGTLKGIDPKRIEYRGWCPTPAYPFVSAILDLDFAVIPLVDNSFNNCKSPLKWLEMAALEVPAVTSFCSPYAEMMDLVADNGMFVEDNSPSGWMIALNQMTQDAQLRRRMGIAARQTVERHFDMEKKWPLWVDAYESLMKKPVEVA
jgi:glycosyltransferase involved in cell wall biosynthesis